MITAPRLEIAVLVLGMVILMFEAFAPKIDKKVFAFIGIAGLAAVLIATFFLTPNAPTDQTSGFWSFYLEFLYGRSVVDLLQAIFAAHHNSCARHDD